LAFVIADAYPVSRGHALIVARRHVESFFDLSEDETAHIVALLRRAKTRLDETCQPAGYNVGINVGMDAGQTIMHVHLHLIPRYSGDVAQPEGGVRNVIPGKGPSCQVSECKKEWGMSLQISKGHLEAVVNCLTWQNKAELHFRGFMRGIAPMSLNDRFWERLDHFRRLVDSNVARADGQPIEDASREFFRLALVTQPPLEAGEYLMDEALRWLQGYKALTGQLSRYWAIYTNSTATRLGTLSIPCLWAVDHFANEP
jgi:diadenosine tetraphosphate (Ap4A) HIT family hydrolase